MLVNTPAKCNNDGSQTTLKFAGSAKNLRSLPMENNFQDEEITPENRAQVIANTQNQLKSYLLEGRATYSQLRRVMKNIESRYAYGITQHDIQTYDKAEKQLSNLMDSLSVRVLQCCRALQKLEDGQSTLPSELADGDKLIKLKYNERSSSPTTENEKLNRIAGRSRRKCARLRYKPYGRFRQSDET